MKSNRKSRRFLAQVGVTTVSRYKEDINTTSDESNFSQGGRLATTGDAAIARSPELDLSMSLVKADILVMFIFIPLHPQRVNHLVTERNHLNTLVFLHYLIKLRQIKVDKT